MPLCFDDDSNDTKQPVEKPNHLNSLTRSGTSVLDGPSDSNPAPPLTLQPYNPASFTEEEKQKSASSSGFDSVRVCEDFRQPERRSHAVHTLLARFLDIDRPVPYVSPRMCDFFRIKGEKWLTYMHFSLLSSLLLSLSHTHTRTLIHR